MKTFKFYFLSILFVFFIISCGNNKTKEDAAEEAAEEFVENMMEKASDGDVNFEIDQDGEKAEITIEGEDGEKITITGNTNEIPENFPKDVYLVKGEITSAGTMASGDGEVITVVIKPENSFGEVVDKVKKEMAGEGWKSAMNMNMGEEAMLMYTKGENSATITVTGKEKNVEIAYMVTIKK